MTMDSLGLYDIYEYAYVPFWHTTPFKIGLIVVCVLITGILLYTIIRIVRARQTENRWQQWFKRLEQIRTEVGDAPLFYTNLSTVCKECIITMLHAPAGITDQELATFVTNTVLFSAALKTKLKSCLEHAIDSKFNPAAISATHKKEDLETVIEALILIEQNEKKPSTQTERTRAL